MNQTFRTSRTSNRRFILRQMLYGLAVAATFPIVMSLLFKHNLDESYYYMISAIMTFSLIREALRDRVVEIEFDSDAQQIIFHYERLFFSKKQRTLSFKNARLEIDTRHSWREKSLIIYFLSTRVEYFKIEKNKDGFSNETLISIRELANKLSLPILKY